MVLSRLDQSGSSGGAGEIGPFSDADYQHQERHSEAPKGLAAETCADQRQRDNGEDEGRERELHVGDPGNEAVHPNSDVPPNETKGHANRGLDAHGEHADGQRNARAVKDGAEEVPALRIGTEQKAWVAAGEPERRHIGVEHVVAYEVKGVLRGDERRRECGERYCPEQECSNHAPWPVEREGADRGISGTRLLPVHRRHSRLMRGSSQRLTTSASVTASRNRNPMPGHWNTVSVSSVKASMLPICRPPSATSGSRALRSAWCSHTLRSDAPLAGAVRP